MTLPASTTLTPADLLAALLAALAPAGPAAASLVAHALVDAEVRGQSRFGLALLAELPAARDELAQRLRPAEPDTAASGRLDLSGRFAPTAVAAALEPARQQAAAHGTSLVRLLAIGKFGRLAPFVAAVAQAGAIGLLTMSSPSFVTPLGGHRAVLGTNPFAVAVPTGAEPLVVDTATSAITAAHWHDASAGRADVPAGALVDASGASTTDATQAVAITPRGGLLGTSLGIAIEALTAAATGQLSDADTAPRGGVLLVIEPTVGAAGLGDELVRRIVDAGGYRPGRRLPWPDRLSVDRNAWTHLEQLAHLA